MRRFSRYVFFWVFAVFLGISGCVPKRVPPAHREIPEPFGQLCRRIVTAAPGDDGTRALCRALQDGRWEKAREICREMMKTRQTPPVILIAAELDLRLHRYGDALRMLDMLENNTLTAEDIQSRADLKRRVLERLDAALDDIRISDDERLEFLQWKIAYYHPEPYVYEDYVNLLFRMERFEEIVDFVPSIPPETRTFGIYRRLGDACFRLKRADAAERAYIEALKFHDDAYVRKQLIRSRMIRLQKSRPEDLDGYENFPWITREQFAELLVWQFDPGGGDLDIPVIADIAGISAPEAVMTVVGEGIMRIGRDHKFHGGARMRRMDVARALYRVALLKGIAGDDDFSQEIPYDIPLTHAASSAIRWCVQMDILPVDDTGRFHAGEIVQGDEIAHAMRKFQELLEMREFLDNPRTSRFE